MRTLPRLPDWILQRKHDSAGTGTVGLGVSSILLVRYGRRCAPGRKSDCPFCGHHTFNIKRDDSVGKCFHPSCLKYIVAHQRGTHPLDDIDAALAPFFVDLHRNLLDMASQEAPTAYHYLIDDRQIHPQVVRDSMLGAVPPGYDPSPHFEAVIEQIAQQENGTEKKRGRGRPPKKRGPGPEERIDLLRQASKKLLACLRPGWLAFFYTDAEHRFVGIRFREPYTKNFAAFKPTETGGVFGNGTFFTN